MLIKDLSHPGHGNSKFCIVGNLFQFLEDVSPLIQENWKSLLDERWNVLKKLKHIQLRSIQH